MSRKKNFDGSVPTSVLIPEALQRALVEKANKEERSFSAVVRRAIKKELGLPIEEDAIKN